MATVRELVTRLGFKTDEKSVTSYNKRVEGAKRAMAGARKAAGALAKGFAVVAGAATAATVAAAKLIQEIADLGDQAAKDARKLGLTTEQVQRLGHAARLSGADFGVVKTGMQAFSRGLEDALTKGTGPAAEAFEELGISMDSTAIQSRDTNAAMGLIADKFAKMPNDGRKTALAMKLFSRSGAELIPFLNTGSEGIEKMGQEFEDLGAVISGDQAAALEQFNDDMLRVKAGMRGLKVTIARELLPVFQEGINDTLEWVKANKDLIAQKVSEWLNRIIPFVRKLFEFIGQLLTVIGGLIDKLGGLDKALLTAAGAFTGLKLASAAALGPVGLIAGAFVALLPIAIQVGEKLGDIAFEMSNIGAISRELDRINGGTTILRGRRAILARTQSSKDAGGANARAFLEEATDAELQDIQRQFEAAEKRGEGVTEFAKLAVQLEMEERNLAKKTAKEAAATEAAKEEAEREKARKRKERARKAAEKAKQERSNAVGITKFNTNLSAIGDAYEARRFNELVASGMSAEEASLAALKERKDREKNNFGLSEKSILDFDPNKAKDDESDPLAKLTGGKLTSGKFGTGDKPGFGTQVVNFNIKQEFRTDIDVEASGINGSTTTQDIEDSMRKVARNVLGEEVKKATLEVVPRVER